MIGENSPTENPYQPPVSSPEVVQAPPTALTVPAPTPETAQRPEQAEADPIILQYRQRIKTAEAFGLPAETIKALQDLLAQKEAERNLGPILTQMNEQLGKLLLGQPGGYLELPSLDPAMISRAVEKWSGSSEKKAYINGVPATDRYLVTSTVDPSVTIQVNLVEKSIQMNFSSR